MPSVLAVDDEPPALREIAHLLSADDRVDRVLTATEGASALRLLEQEDIDIVFLDIRMPGLSGLDLARVLARFRQPPAVVFVTAYETHAVDAFDVQAVDYVMKPYRPARLTAALGRALEHIEGATATAPDEPDESIPVELGGVTRFVRRSEIRFVTAQGDYARLHTADGSHLLRMPLATLEERWAEAGFVRIHRSHLVSLQHVEEIRVDGGRYTVIVGGQGLAVSRRHTRELRDLLVKRASR
ncbi:LytR/AlgR family response regulator transcription factor [Ornithinimicrobium faecis]|uniref:LytTR family DNA-binding domain-containing protein n=1 Tax=Ornithinimicrobium faecis TaxID=2934158 RepID=A0ABY4YNA4_9MICO|nr:MULTISPECIES: LytTR family DNA-binding domain-containing protein [unclassified Ornithinimicrobium]USQ78211.1 LytTR family DNA-binding domain-containing protein [Ornithinimicrobium sp. HY1793]